MVFKGSTEGVLRVPRVAPGFLVFHVRVGFPFSRIWSEVGYKVGAFQFHGSGVLAPVQEWEWGILAPVQEWEWGILKPVQEWDRGALVPVQERERAAHANARVGAGCSCRCRTGRRPWFKSPQPMSGSEWIVV